MFAACALCYVAIQRFSAVTKRHIIIRLRLVNIITANNDGGKVIAYISCLIESSKQLEMVTCWQTRHSFVYGTHFAIDRPTAIRWKHTSVSIIVWTFNVHDVLWSYGNIPKQRQFIHSTNSLLKHIPCRCSLLRKKIIYLWQEVSYQLHTFSITAAQCLKPAREVELQP